MLLDYVGKTLWAWKFQFTTVLKLLGKNVSDKGHHQTRT